jgi:hypothetical protein
MIGISSAQVRTSAFLCGPSSWLGELNTAGEDALLNCRECSQRHQQACWAGAAVTCVSIKGPSRLEAALCLNEAERQMKSRKGCSSG